jgi:hypothetical protein
VLVRLVEPNAIHDRPKVPCLELTHQRVNRIKAQARPLIPPPRIDEVHF